MNKVEDLPQWVKDKAKKKCKEVTIDALVDEACDQILEQIRKENNMTETKEFDDVEITKKKEGLSEQDTTKSTKSK